MTKSQLNSIDGLFINYATAHKNIHKIKCLTFNDHSLRYTTLYDMNANYIMIFKEFMK